MKQKNIFIAVLTAMLLMVPAMVQAQSKGKAKTLEVSFNYQKQAGPGSNQYAVWIENEAGEVVKTLFVTSYTTKGRVRGNEQPMRGYVKRPNCVPAWVKASKANEKTDQELDAVTGATPQAGGKQRFTWDFTDQQGKKVKDGKYCVKVEATLYQASTILYTGIFSTKDKTGNIPLTSKLTQPEDNHKDMITAVQAVLK